MNSSQESSNLNLFSLGIQNLWSDSENSTDNSPDTRESYEFSENNFNTEPQENPTFADLVLLGVFLTPALFIFTSVFWIALFDGESFLMSLGVLIVLLVFLGIPLLVAAAIGGAIPAGIVYSILDFLLIEDELGRELSNFEMICYSITSLSLPVLFHIHLLRSASTETTLIQALWPATKFATIWWLVLLILTTASLFLWWLVTNPVDTE